MANEKIIKFLRLKMNKKIFLIIFPSAAANSTAGPFYGEKKSRTFSNFLFKNENKKSRKSEL